MQATKRTYYKAFLLFAAFSLNTVVSFACSFSNLFHGIHHHETAAASTAEHEHSGNHHAAAQKDTHEHDDQQEHKHGTDSSDDSKDDCCSRSVVEIEKAEKAVSRSIEAPHAIFIASFFATYSSLFQIDIIQNTRIPTNIRWRLPATIQDLRIVIQSFQI